MKALWFRFIRWLKQQAFEFAKDVFVLWLADRVASFALSHPNNRELLNEFLAELEENLQGEKR